MFIKGDLEELNYDSMLAKLLRLRSRKKAKSKSFFNSHLVFERFDQVPSDIPSELIGARVFGLLPEIKLLKIAKRLTFVQIVSVPCGFKTVRHLR